MSWSGALSAVETCACCATATAGIAAKAEPASERAHRETRRALPRRIIAIGASPPNSLKNKSRRTIPATERLELQELRVVSRTLPNYGDACIFSSLVRIRADKSG